MRWFQHKKLPEFTDDDISLCLAAFATKVSPNDLSQRGKDLQDKIKALMDQSSTDPLTVRIRRTS